MAAVLVTAAACSEEAPIAEPTGGGAVTARNFDARDDYNANVHIPPSGQQLALLRARFPHAERTATFDGATGVTRTLYNPVGFLTRAQPGTDPMTIARSFALDNYDLLGLERADVADVEVLDYVPSRVSGTTHVYTRQLHQGLPVYNAQLHVNIARDGSILGVNNQFAPRIVEAANSPHPAVSATDALRGVATHLGVALDVPPLSVSRSANERFALLQSTEMSINPIPATLMWLSVRAGEVRLVWNMQLETPDSQHWYDINVDAETGKVWTRADWTNSAEYTVYPQPVETPNHGDRALVVNPQDATASPDGWHQAGSTSYTIMRGNNVHAYEDGNGSNSPPSSQPDCGSGLECNFPIDLSLDPNGYEPAAVANLFYWNNLIHDIQYQYGFDEAGGNFQVNTFGRGGAGGDDVRAEAQDGGGTNNANFSTPPDGSRARMQMFLWTTTSPRRDGDVDNGIIVHEYGHGISIRQVGGPSSSSCLNNRQQGGEGWSDWFALWYTAEAGDSGTDKRGIGTYALGEPTSGDGIRTQPYSTSSGFNNWTYESINGMAVPHGVGSVWAQAIWEVYWALVDEHGFSTDPYDRAAGFGNHRALTYVNEGLKFTSCNPTFVDARDGIIQAATANFGGDDVCTIWKTFAAFGLGEDAVSGGSGSTNPSNGFAIPAACDCSPQASADAGADAVVCAGDSVTIGTAAEAGTTYSWEPGGATSAQINVTPSSTTTYTVTATTACGSDTDTVTVTVDDGTGDIVLHKSDFEDGANGWAHSDADSTCSTGDWGVGDPDGVTTGAITTQLEDDHTSSGINALFTEPNGGGVGTNDVDGGVCTAKSPVVAVAAGATAEVSLWYYHGQRDAGDDASGDFFRVGLSTNGGGSFTNIVDIGDVESSAAWTQVTQTVTGPAEIALRVQASDGSGAGDIVEGGIDDVLITSTSTCTSTPTCQPPEFGGVTSVTDNEADTCGVTVGWNPATGRCDNANITYSVHRGTTPDFVPSASNRIADCVAGTELVDADVAFGDTYYYVVRAEDGNAGDAGSCNGGLIDGNTISAGASPTGGAGGVLHATDFESGANGWGHSNGDSTCSTGDWTVGDPDGVTNGGVVTQLEDDHTAGSGINALFTAPNTGSAGVDDVDGGQCTALSPLVNVAAGTTANLSLWYYHGQRDAGDDPSGDFFRIDLSTDNGASYGTSLVSDGDITSDAAWTQVEASVVGPAQIKLRVQASDGAGPGDLVEGGIDDVLITADAAACTTASIP